MEVSNIAKVKCPHCGWEYLPCEIFMPNDFAGKSKNIIRDALGKILYVEFEDGFEPEQKEKYICDNCGKEFTAQCSMAATTDVIDEAEDFSNEFVSLL